MATLGSEAAAALLTAAFRPPPPSPTLEPSATTKIDLDGDIVLVAGPSQRRLRVSSAVLGQASEFFRNLFGPFWAEGQRMRCGGSKVFILAEDNEDALESLCTIAHRKGYVIHWTTPPKEIYDIAVLVDKYQCFDPISSSSYSWLIARPGDMNGLAYRMAAAYLVRNVRAFNKITKDLIFNHAGSYLPLLQGDCKQIFENLPAKVLNLLAERRCMVLNGMNDVVSQGCLEPVLTKTLGSGPYCEIGWADQLPAMYNYIRGQFNLWQPHFELLGLSLREVRDL